MALCFKLMSPSSRYPILAVGIHSSVSGKVAFGSTHSFGERLGPEAKLGITKGESFMKSYTWEELLINPNAAFNSPLELAKETHLTIDERTELLHAWAGVARDLGMTSSAGLDAEIKQVFRALELLVDIRSAVASLGQDAIRIRAASRCASSSGLRRL